MLPTARVLVCGGRTFGYVPSVYDLAPWEDESHLRALKIQAEKEKLYFNKVMDAAAQKFDIECIIEGGAKGADRLARNWALEMEIKLHTCQADWKNLGRKAGIVRNQTMLDEYAPTLTVAFPGGDGTKDMVTRSRKAGVRVIEVPAL